MSRDLGRVDDEDIRARGCLLIILIILAVVLAAFMFILDAIVNNQSMTR